MFENGWRNDIDEYLVQEVEMADLMHTRGGMDELMDERGKAEKNECLLYGGRGVGV